MELVVKIVGHRCDLALHPISPNSAEIINRLGRSFYKQKYLEWWRKGTTCTCGVKYDDACAVEVVAGGSHVPFDYSAISGAARLHGERHYLDTKVRYLGLFGYDDEFCQSSWTWRGVEGFDPARLEFLVHRWDRFMDAQDYLIIEDIRYDGRWADAELCGKSMGFNLVDPKVIDLGALRGAMAAGEGRMARAS